MVAKATPREGLPVPLGQLTATPGVLRKVTSAEIQEALSRHRNGDWGDLSDADKELNDESLRNGSRLLSSYRAADGTAFWIITEADRSVTTVLLPDEY